MSAVPLLEAVLGPQDRAELMRDIEALTHVYSVQVEDDTGSRACRLDEAFAAMELRTGRRVRIRYRHEGRIWMDTLLQNGDEVRLVRVAEDDVASDDIPSDDTAPDDIASDDAAPAGGAEGRAR